MIAAAQTRTQESSRNMEQQEPPEFILDVFADPRSVREVVKGSFSWSETRSPFFALPLLPYTTLQLPATPRGPQTDVHIPPGAQL